MPTKTRVEYIDVLRAIAIILVIIGHIPYPGFSTTLHKWIYAFHIPLFFFVSGMSLCFTNYSKLSLKANFRKRFFRIYSPYLIWGIALALPNITIETILKLLYGTHQSIASVSNSSLWFLPVLFIATLLIDMLLYTLHRIGKRKFLPLMLLFIPPIVLLIPTQATMQSLLGGHNLPFGIDIVPMAIFFMLSGYLLQSRKICNRHRFSALFYFLLILLFLLITTYFSLCNDVNYVLMAENRYGNYIYFFIAAFSGIMASFLLSKTIAKYTIKLSQILQKIGSDTLLIFILHKYPLLLVNDIVTLIPVAYIPNYFIVPIYLLFSLVICVPISSYIKKHAPFLTGGLVKSS